MKFFLKNTQSSLSLTRWMTAMVIFLCVFSTYMPGLAHAAPPPANTVIGNRATASFVDGTGTPRTVTSNLVRTTVQQVYSHDLTADNDMVVAPGGTVYFPHTLKNTGNGVDSFALSTAQLTNDNFDLRNMAIYADTDSDGRPDSTTPITSSGPLAAGQHFRFVVSGSVSNGQAHATSAKFRVGAVGHENDPNNYTASSTAPSAAQKGNTDTAKVSTAAVVNVTKSYSVATGPANNTLTVTLRYNNSSSVSATGLVIFDVIGARGSFLSLPSDTRQMRYVANSTKINGIAVNDHVDSEVVAGVSFMASTGLWRAVIDEVAPAASGTVTFMVEVINATPRAEQTTNIAGYQWTGDSGEQKTNAVSYTVAVSDAASVALGDSRVGGTRGGSETSSRNNRSGVGAGSVVDASTITSPADSDGLDNGIVLNQVPRGGSPVFHAILTNTGVVADHFNLTVENISYPEGTRFELVDAAGVLMTDSNGDGIADSGALSSRAAMDVFVRATLPADAEAPATGWTAKLKATSTNNNAISDLTSIKVVADSNPAGGVDVRNTSVTGPGGGFASGDNLAAATLINSGEPGQTISFKLWVKNGTSTADSYDLQSFGTYTVNANAADASGALATGWTVSFTSTGNSDGGANCPEAGTTISNTGTIAAGSSCEFNANVTIPAGSDAGTNSLYFRAWSSAYGVDDATGAGYDVIRNDVTVTRQTSSGLSLIKTQKLVDCTTGDGAGDFLERDFAEPVAPGRCLRYRVEATNTSDGVLTDLNIADSTPRYTTLRVGGNCQVEQSGVSGELGGVNSDGSSGRVILTVRTLQANASSGLEYCVKIDE